jgi:hypothetical protein
MTRGNDLCNSTRQPRYALLNVVRREAKRVTTLATVLSMAICCTRQI